MVKHPERTASIKRSTETTSRRRKLFNELREWWMWMSRASGVTPPLFEDLSKRERVVQKKENGATEYHFSSAEMDRFWRVMAAQHHAEMFPGVRWQAVVKFLVKSTDADGRQTVTAVCRVSDLAGQNRELTDQLLRRLLSARELWTMMSAYAAIQEVDLVDNPTNVLTVDITKGRCVGLELAKKVLEYHERQKATVLEEAIEQVRAGRTLAGACQLFSQNPSQDTWATLIETLGKNTLNQLRLGTDFFEKQSRVLSPGWEKLIQLWQQELDGLLRTNLIQTELFAQRWVFIVDQLTVAQDTFGLPARAQLQPLMQRVREHAQGPAIIQALKNISPEVQPGEKSVRPPVDYWIKANQISY